MIIGFGHNFHKYPPMWKYKYMEDCLHNLSIADVISSGSAARVSVSAPCVLIMSIMGHMTRDTWHRLIGHSVISTNNQHGHQTTCHILKNFNKFFMNYLSPHLTRVAVGCSVYQKVIPASILSMHCQFIIIRSLEVENTAYRQEFVQMWTYEWGVFAACKVIPMAPIRHPAATCKCWSPDTRD